LGEKKKTIYLQKKTMNLQPNLNFEELKKKLDQFLSNSFRPHIDEIPKIKSKGIYFWFMKTEGYNQLSKYAEIKPIEPSYTKEIDGVKYDLVYLGTAGVRNNKSGINKGHLEERLNWHLAKNKSKSALKSGTMSTYRRTIGALIEDDLIENNTQKSLDNFFRDTFIIFFIEYPGSFTEVKEIVNRDETLLIEIVRPIFNLDKNPNAKITNHITYLIQERRQLIEKSSKSKLGIIEKKERKVKMKTNKEKVKFQLNECAEFKVHRNQNIIDVANDLIDLPVGPCTIEIFSNDRSDVRKYVNGKIRKITKFNRSVSSFFIAPDTNYETGNISKSKIISDEMNNVKKPIEEITVRVCPII
jgi:hypothetical protein